MTNKEAIKILRKGYPDIKRYATIELGAYEYDVEAYNEALNLAIKALEERPQGWIPVKTRELTAEEKEEHPYSIFMWDCPLPDTPQDVLITTKWGDVQLCTFCEDFNGSYFDEMDDDEVLAWMPLPVPYTKEERT